MPRRYVILAIVGVTAAGVTVLAGVVWLMIATMSPGPGVIQKSQYDAVQIGETRPQVLAKLGPPLTDPGYIDDYGVKPRASSCDYYNEDDVMGPVAFRFCYRDNRLVAKTVSGS